MTESLTDRLAFGLQRAGAVTATTVQCATFAAARVLAEPSHGTLLGIPGRDEVDDGYGGVFAWNATSEVADDNNNTIKISDVEIGRWVRLGSFAGITLTLAADGSLARNIHNVEGGVGREANIVTALGETIAAVENTVAVENAKAAGAAGDDTTVDTTALQTNTDAAIATVAGYRRGARINWPKSGGRYVLTDTVKLTDAMALIAEGDGGQTIFVWRGPSDRPAFLIESIWNGLIGHITIEVDAGYHLYAGFQLTSKTGASMRSRDNGLVKLRVITDGRHDYGFIIGGAGDDANNDFHRFVQCESQGHMRDAWLLDNSQVYEIVTEGCKAIGYWKTTAATVGGGAATVTIAAPAAWSGVTAYVADDRVLSGGVVYRCKVAHTNQAPPNATYWEVWNINASMAVGDVYDMTIGANTWRFAVGAISHVAGVITLTIGAYFDALGTVSDGAGTLRYGGQTACFAKSGNIHWNGGGGGQHLKADFVFGAANSGTDTVCNSNWESSRRAWMHTSQTPGGTKHVTWKDNRFAGNEVLDCDFNTILMQMPGSTVISGGCLGDPNFETNCKIVYAHNSGANQQNSALTVEHLSIANEDATSVQDLFPNAPPTTSRNNKWTTTGTTAVFNDVALVKTFAGAGTRTLEMVYPEHKVTIDDTTTFVFNGLPTRSPRRIHLINAGNDAVTWPTITWLTGSAPQSGWIEVWTDGTTVWGAASGSPTAQGASLYRNASAVTIVATGSYQDLTDFSGQNHTASGVTVSVGSGTITINETGLWEVAYAIDIEADTTGSLLFRLARDGSGALGSDTKLNLTATATPVRAVGVMQLTCAATEVLKLQFSFTAAAVVTAANGHFTVKRLG